MHLPAELEALELKEEFARRLGEQQRTIDILKVCARVGGWHLNGWPLAVGGACAPGERRTAPTQPGMMTTACVQDTNQKLQAKVRDAAADSSTAVEAAAKKLNSRIKELESERDKLASKVHVLEAQLEEARQALAVAQQSAAQEVELLQQQHAEAAHAAQQDLAATSAKLQEQLAVVQAAAAAGSKQAAAAAAEKEAALSAALTDAQAAVAALEAAAAENEQRHRKALARMQDHARQLEAEKQVGCGASSSNCACVWIMACCAPSGQSGANIHSAGCPAA